MKRKNGKCKLAPKNPSQVGGVEGKWKFLTSGSLIYVINSALKE